MSGGDAPPLFVLEDVSQERGGRAILHGLRLALPAGEVVALIGPSGAGKSSLARLLNRLDDPTQGSIHFRGAPLRDIPVRALRRRVGFVFQAPTMFPGTVADNLRAAHSLAAPATESSGEAVLSALLASVELDAGYLERDAATLSGGEQQRVSIARALATTPDVLVLDEPTAALDPEVAERLMATIARLGREGLSVIMVTHRLAEARLWSTTTIMLEAGRVVEQGATRTVFETPREPRTRAFIGSAS